MKPNDGGPAFPSRDYQTDTVLVDGHEEDWQGWIVKPGMTYRQWLVGMALQGYNANSASSITHNEKAKLSIKDADAAIKAEQAKPKEQGDAGQ